MDSNGTTSGLTLSAWPIRLAMMRWHLSRRSPGGILLALSLAVICLGVACVALLIDRRSESALRADVARLRAAMQVEIARDNAAAPARQAAGDVDLRIAQLRIDLDTSQEWVAALQQRLAVRQDEERLVARAFAERDAAVADRDRALAGAHQGAETEIGLLTEQTKAALRDVDTIIAATGLDPKRLAPPTVPDRRNERGLPRGGPLVPVAPALLPLLENTERLRQLTGVLRQMPLSSPVPVVSVTSPFGYRMDPFTGTASLHEGVDLQGPLGAPIAATGPGVVVFAGWRPDYGEMVELDHGFGLRTRYAHLSHIRVFEGEHVALHQAVGLLGMTGRATGPHLHYEVRLDDRALNPLRFFKANNFVLP